jgi:hypothetical protein
MDVGSDQFPAVATDRRGRWITVWGSWVSFEGTREIPFSIGWGPDRDQDDLADGAEEYFYGTDPSDADSDDDGLDDGDEISGVGTDPLDPDHDNDNVCDGSGIGGGACAAGPDNCPFVVNGAQANSDTAPAGDGCQCGDVAPPLGIDATDVERARELVVGRTPGGTVDANFCDVTGDILCTVSDLFVIDRIANGQSAIVVDACVGYFGL